MYRLAAELFSVIVSKMTMHILGLMKLLDDGLMKLMDKLVHESSELRCKTWHHAVRNMNTE